MRHTSRALLLILLLAHAAAAQTPSQKWDAGKMATAKLIGQGDGYQSVASCVIVGYHESTGMAVACSHQVQGERSWQIWPIGHERAYQATPIFRSAFGGTWQPDLSVFTFKPSRIPAIATVATRNPRIGASVQVRGYPLGSAYQQGKSMQVAASRPGCLTLSRIAQQGDSGGAILDESTGELVGILSATGLTDSIATDIETVRHVLTKYCQWGQQWGASCDPLVSGQVRPDQVAPSPVQVKPGASQGYTLSDQAVGVWIDRMAADGRFQGRDGPPGQDGRDGAPGPPGADGQDGRAAEVDYELIRAMLGNDGTFRGPTGAQGPPGPQITSEQLAAAVGQWIEANPERAAKLIVPHLPPIYFRKVNGLTGKELSPPDAVFLGEGFTFFLTPGRQE